MKACTTLLPTLLLFIFTTSTVFAQGRGGEGAWGMRGSSAQDFSNQPRWGQMRHRHGMKGTRGGRQQGGLGQGRWGDFGGGANQNVTGQLTQEETDSILLMREEEKLARDVYLTLADQWNVPVFRNIAQSESRHMQAVKMLIDRYGLEDPVTDDTIGVFTRPEFAQMYQELVASGSVSLSEAYKVGIRIEEMDIQDLREALDHVQSPDIRRVYQNLLRASENHLRAFSLR